ncbi:hypothetical protein ICV01_06355 [Polynucleobacter sp. MWH-Spelu-300-X4]|uniref:hypothetical protein n=1 Tax=Polynucleobacter sp. MWH-Spelu-300-X4 TaxID=2689109 RepID=UPI001BFDBD61|nr:hypothetical protein [Polynucleobacter sp. MWH-Spelu-300-X4]QWD79269.1 hypothetical protein ICV01_06355 [Polynucleobacter sp. MWH-Spelu-300-X4]
MSGNYYQKAETLLDIIHELALANEISEIDGFPFKEGGGSIQLHPTLKEKLEQHENPELHQWAIENIKELF